MEIVGVTFGKPERNARWADKHGYPYEIWSDPDRSLALALGAAGGENQMVARRVTRVLDAEARVVLAYDDVSVRSHPEDVLEDCRELFTPRGRAGRGTPP